MTRRRKLRPEEEALWQQVAGTAEPLARRRAKGPAPKTPPKPLGKQAGAAPAPLQPFEIGRNAPRRGELRDHAATVGAALEARPVAMDRKAYGRMKRGKLQPEARLDLHGMTLAQAHPRLTGFILRAHSEGMRLVLVITGKGKHRDDGGPIPQRVGALRHQVPAWLDMPPLSQIVLQVTPAHLRHGGGGAYYVYLRRR